MGRHYLVAGNWKMNGAHDANAALMGEVLKGVGGCPDVELLVCPPAVYIESVGALLASSGIRLGAQNLCEQEKQGAYTGEIHGGMLGELGCSYVIVGHSERRGLYSEDDARVAQKFITAQKCGLTPILCVGETLEERDSGQTEAVVQRQLDAVLNCSVASLENTVVAYEPVWAIGTGRTATPEQAQAVHAFLRQRLAAADAKLTNSVRILYGGSVKADNAATLFDQPDVDGGLIGGASLKAVDFLAICAAAQALTQ